MNNDIQNIAEAYDRVPDHVNFKDTAKAKDRAAFQEWMNGRDGALLRGKADPELLYKLWVDAQRYGRWPSDYR